MTPRRSFLKTALAAPFLPQAALALPEDPAYWTRVREQFMLSRDKAFFNTGTIGAMPRVVYEKTVEHLRKMATDVADWDYTGPDWIAGYSDVPAIRGKAAKLLNCDLKELALTDNVTSANSYVASGMDLPAGAEIIMSDQEHVGGESPWQNAAARRGGTVTKFALPKPAHDAESILAIVMNAMRPRTKVLFLSHVITASGAILPVKQICAEARQRGIFTVIDGAQAFGHVPVDVKEIGCDAYVGCFHKWMLAPAGEGFLYLRGDRAPGIWSSVASHQWNNHDDNGLRFSQRGTGSMSLMMGLEAALDFHNQIGAERIQQRIKYLGDYLRANLRKIPQVKIYSPDDAAMCAGITVYGVDGVGGPQLAKEMWDRARLRPRGSSAVAIRHCTHIYNSTEEIDKSLAIVRSLARG
ncbi:MAG TPA: aminotransferase class V-fold PLP-dependent enzyme [Candidatus Sulfopaludibacter sp.]|jgi:selenocysteine lyase/cysteine desulfurase|nr:aminotransferase class V-fold PLP-dependent enzyme [Candidatus Sulfopaludibacter sp.]